MDYVCVWQSYFQFLLGEQKFSADLTFEILNKIRVLLLFPQRPLYFNLRNL